MSGFWIKKEWLVPTWVMAMLIAACSSDPAGESCVDDEDCTGGDVCQEQVCVDEDNVGEADVGTPDADELHVGAEDVHEEPDVSQDADVNDELDVPHQEDVPTQEDASQDVHDSDVDDAGGDDTGHDDAGHDDADSGATESCEIEVPCDRLVDSDVTTVTGLRLPTEDKDYERYGCLEDGSALRDVEPVSLQAETCVDDLHRYRMRVRTCTEVDFLVYIEVIPQSDICPVQDFADVEFRLELGSGPECQGTTQSECYVVEDTPDHGGHLWSVRFIDVFQDTETVPIDILVTPDSGYSVPYELGYWFEEQ